MADGQGGQNSSHRTEQATDVKEGEIGSRDHRCSWMGRRPRSGRGMRKSRGRHNPKLAAKKTSPTESNSKEQLRKETEGTAFRDRGNSSSKDRQTAIATRAINEDDGYGFRRITRQQHSEDSTGEHHYPDSSFTKSRDSYRDHDQRPRYSRKLQGRGRTGLTCGRYQVNSWDKNEQSIQSGELTEQLLQGSYDCVICCDTIQPKDSVWNCAGCYHIFHLKCIQKWARSSATSSDSAESGKNWRCPCCQRSYQKIPSLYFCFCGKVKNPSHNTRETFGYICPHSCGDVCGKRRDIKGCIHKCTMQCHPGPCPECPVVVNASCPCGRTMSRVRCSQSSKMSSCGRTCGKCLDCGKHFCSQLCHRGPCQPCERLLSIMCFCGKEKQTVQCSSKMLLSMGFSCTRPCGKPLGCRNHCCEQQCHRGVCLSCPLLPESTQHCPCGRTSIAKLLTVPRVSCLDPIPTCDNMCGRQLICGNVPKGCMQCVRAIFCDRLSIKKEVEEDPDYSLWWSSSCLSCSQ